MRIGLLKNEVFGGVCIFDGVDDIVLLFKDKLKDKLEIRKVILVVVLV